MIFQEYSGRKAKKEEALSGLFFYLFSSTTFRAFSSLAWEKVS
jgi:hypothetical protein